MTTTAPFRAVASTHVGRKRKTNQDCSAIPAVQHPNGTYHLLIVADGMGGGVKGDVASRTAVDAVLDYFRTTGWYNPEEASREAAFSANRAVFDKGTGGGRATKSFMGTTLVFALVEEVTNRAWITNIGDSRAYLLRHGVLEQVTRDHSVLGDFATEGAPLTPEEIARLRNVVTRAVGLAATVEPDIFGPIELDPADRLLLTTDGLHGVVRDDRIQRLSANQPMERALKSLIGAANAAGGPDNITAVMGGREEVPASSTAASRRLPGVLAVAAAGSAAIAALLAIVWLALDDDSPPEPPPAHGSPMARWINDMVDAVRVPRGPTDTNRPLDPPLLPIPPTRQMTLQEGQGCDVLYAAVVADLDLQRTEQDRLWFHQQVEEMDSSSATCVPATFNKGAYEVPYGTLRFRSQ